MYFKRQTDQFLLNPSSFHLPLRPFSPLRLPACCKSLSRPERGSQLKRKRREGRRGRKSWHISEMELQVEHRATKAKYGKTTIDATAGHMYVLDQFRLEWKHVFKHLGGKK